MSGSDEHGSGECWLDAAAAICDACRESWSDWVAEGEREGAE